MKYWEKFIDKVGIYQANDVPRLIQITGMHVTEEGKLHFKGRRILTGYTISLEMSRVKLCVLQIGMTIRINGTSELVNIKDIYHRDDEEVYVTYEYRNNGTRGEVKLDQLLVLFQNYVEVWI